MQYIRFLLQVEWEVGVGSEYKRLAGNICAAAGFENSAAHFFDCYCMAGKNSHGRRVTPAQAWKMVKGGYSAGKKFGGAAKKYFKGKKIQKAKSRSQFKRNKSVRRPKFEVDSSFVAGKFSYASHKFSSHKKPNRALIIDTGPCVDMQMQSYSTSSNDDFSAWNSHAVLQSAQMERVFQEASNMRQLAIRATATSANDFAHTNYKLYLTYGEVEYRFSNASIVTCTLDLYDFDVNRDTSILPHSWFATDVLDLGIDRDLTFASDTVLASGSGLFKPSDSPGYRLYYKTKKRTQLILAPGETHIHKVKYAWNKILPSVLGEELVLYFKGYTGGLCWKQTGSAITGTGTTANLSNTEVLVVATTRIGFRVIAAPVSHIEWINANPTAPTFNRFVNEALGEVMVSGTGPLATGSTA